MGFREDIYGMYGAPPPPPKGPNYDPFGYRQPSGPQGDPAQAGFSPNNAEMLEATSNLAPGYQMGTRWDRQSTDPNLTGTSYMRPDQSKAERYAEQRNDYFYGGEQAGAENAIAGLRSNMSPYTGQLSGNAGAYFNQGMGASTREAPLAQGYLDGDHRGQVGQYDIASQMQQMAALGPGPSQAQAQLQANTGMAMRQQLALAGSGRGAGGDASAYRNAAMQQAQIQGSANAQAGVLQAQEDAAWRQQQAGLLSASGDLYGQGRAADIAAAGYVSGTQLQQTGLNDQYSLGMGGLSNDALNNAGQLQLGTEGTAHQINTGALTGNMAYESNLSNIYGINMGGQQQPETMNPYVAAAINTASNILPYIASTDEGDEEG
jgi:hypothetical protein